MLLVLGIGSIILGIFMIWAGLRSDYHEERIAALEKAIGSGLARGLRSSDCRRSDGLGAGPEREEWVDRAIRSGVEAYRRGYRPF